MKRFAALWLTCALLATGTAPAAQSADAATEVQSNVADAGAQSTVALETNKVVSVPVAGATSAYGVNPSVADASVVDGVVRIRGIGGGTTSVVVITPRGSTTLTVAVSSPQLAQALGVQAGADGNSAAFDTTGSGTYEGTYDSSAGQVTNAFDFAQNEGHTYRRMAVIAATIVSPSSTLATKGTGFPLVSYEVKRPGSDVVYLDEAVTTSPLTFDNVLIRGFHVVAGGWTFHTGASSIASFGPYFIPTNAQWVVGATRSYALSKSSGIAANFYDIINGAGNQTTTLGGLIGSVMYSYQQPHFNASAELGLSRSVGFAASANYQDDAQQGQFSIVDKPYTFATLAAQGQQGLTANLDYGRTLSSALTVSASAQKSDYDLPAFRENTTSAQGTANVQISKDWSASGGALYSSFDSLYPTAFGVRTLGIPIAVSYSSAHFSAGVSDTPTSDFSGTTANGYGANIGLNYGRFQASGFYQHSVDIPTVSSIFSEVPGLQAALVQAGINVSDPSQLAALLNNAALLASLGFSGLQLNLAPARNDIGINGAWVMPGVYRQEVAISYLDSRAQLTLGTFDFRLGSVQYVRGLGFGNQIALSLSSIESTSSVPASATSPASTSSSGSHLGVGVAFRHRFGAAPPFLFPQRRGTIDGYVFRDDEATGSFARSDQGLSGIDVVLDNGRTVRTDSSGHYVFSGVSFGPHEVAARVQSAKPFYFTTDSPSEASINSTVNFGVTFVTGKIFGMVTNDAGAGIGGVSLIVSGLGKTVRSESDGRFVIEGVAPGHYEVSAAADSFPAGYDVSALTPASIDVTTSAPWPVNVTARALRSISGTVTVFDVAKLALSPAQGMEVSIPQLGIVARTDSNGAYTIRDLPAGTYAVVVEGGTASQRRIVVMPPDPTTLTGIDFRVTIGQINKQRKKEREQERRQRQLRLHRESTARAATKGASGGSQ